jgi:hypothetical protein
MEQFTEGLPIAAVTRRERTAATMSHAANLVILKAAYARLGDYIETAAHAFETGNLREGQALALAITHAINAMSEAGHALGDAIDRELSAQRQVAA